MGIWFPSLDALSSKKRPENESPAWLGARYEFGEISRAMRTFLVDEAAALLGVSRRTIYYRIREGRLQTIRIGVTQRVLFDSIAALLREQAALRDRAAGVSGRDPCGRSPAP